MTYALAQKHESTKLPVIRNGCGQSHYHVFCLGRQAAEIRRTIYKPKAAILNGIAAYRIAPMNKKGAILYGGLGNTFFSAYDQIIAEINTLPHLYERQEQPSRSYGVAIGGIDMGRLERPAEPSRNRLWLFRIEPGPYVKTFEWLDCLSFASIDTFLKILMIDFQISRPAAGS